MSSKKQVRFKRVISYSAEERDSEIMENINEDSNQSNQSEIEVPTAKTRVLCSKLEVHAQKPHPGKSEE